ncbi:vWA domain-containing protein [Calycomorphotria hydatis]|uniref:von Willebrand factor type A domain protein n=1 Tax=Calycomorphotria hydatis TaxID=2528027 RepID=A0A517T3N2_9PLAN|nr:VWA domain-containing protein [Calycomorphotria hydatis]QDT62987.1 von Willebrand factor type A domain protein [Calycomorphotria hydatis]
MSPIFNARLKSLSHKNRRGAVIVLFAALVVVFLAMTMFTVDLAYVNLVRSELRAATDAAARAGVEALSRYQDEDAALAEVIAVAQANQVNGKPLVIQPNQIEFGQSVRQDNGVWKFFPDVTPLSAVRVNAELNSNSPNGQIPLFFAPMFGHTAFDTSEEATASNLDHEVVLVMDRSGSMKYNLTGIDGMYPVGSHSNTPPDPEYSRWAALQRGVDIYFDYVRLTYPPQRVALVTFSTSASKDIDLTTDYESIEQELADRGSTRNGVNGFTNVSDGMNDAIDILTGNNARDLSLKTMIVFTDGEWNRGSSPVTAAQNAAAENITVHTITMLYSGRGREDMQAAAAAGGGTYTHANNDEELEDAFKKIALTLPVVLTD